MNEGLWLVRFVLEQINITTLVEASNKQEAITLATEKVEDELGQNLLGILEIEAILEGTYK